MDLSSNLIKQLLNLTERMEIQNKAFLTKKSTQKLSKEVQSYYKNTDLLTMQIRQALLSG